MKKQLMMLTTAFALVSGPAFAETIHVGVDGLVCAFCVKGIEKSFKKQAETKTVEVNLDEKLVTVVTKDGMTLKDEKIRKLLTDAGYEVSGIHHQK